jgi:hypothetical protein
MEIERMKVYCIITFKSVSLHVNDSLTYMTEEGDNKIYSLMDIHSIIFGCGSSAAKFSAAAPAASLLVV